MSEHTYFMPCRDFDLQGFLIIRYGKSGETFAGNNETFPRNLYRVLKDHYICTVKVFQQIVNFCAKLFPLSHLPCMV